MILYSGRYLCQSNLRHCFCFHTRIILFRTSKLQTTHACLNKCMFAQENIAECYSIVYWYYSHGRTDNKYTTGLIGLIGTSDIPREHGEDRCMFLVSFIYHSFIYSSYLNTSAWLTQLVKMVKNSLPVLWRTNYFTLDILYSNESSPHEESEYVIIILIKWRTDEQSC